MNRRNVFTKLLVSFALVAVAGTAIFWAVRQTRAQQTTIRQARFASIGLVRGQTARINFSSIIGPEAPPDPCRVRLAFADNDGNILRDPRTGEPVSKTMTLQNGQSTSLQVNASDFLSGDAIGATRLQLRPLVLAQVQVNSDGTVPPDPCAPVVEVIDNATAKTSFVYPGSERMGWQNHNETLVRDRARK
jgi:hypothetical protein